MLPYKFAHVIGTLSNKRAFYTQINFCMIWRVAMDKDRLEGGMKNIKGRMKEGAGRAAGDSKLESEGKMDKAEGKIQNTIGGMKDAIRGK